MTDLDLTALAKREPMWSCSICGPADRSGPSWCDQGCGRDYNRMTPIVCLTVAERDALVAKVERLRAVAEPVLRLVATFDAAEGPEPPWDLSDPVTATLCRLFDAARALHPQEQSGE